MHAEGRRESDRSNLAKLCSIIKINLQHHGNNCQELPVAGELLSIIHLLPPSQSIVDPLVFGKGSSFFPVEELISYLTRIRLLNIENGDVNNSNLVLKGHTNTAEE